MKPCFCSRAPRGFAWIDLRTPPLDRKPIVHACSMRCLNLIQENKGAPIIVTKDIETQAVDRASGVVGEYLETLGKTDLAAMTADEWEGFLLFAHRAIAGQVAAICDQDVPF